MTTFFNDSSARAGERAPDARSLERFRLLVENSLDLIAEVAQDGRILYLSPNVLTVLGYDPEATVGLTIFDLIHPDDLTEVQEYFALPEGRLT